MALAISGLAMCGDNDSPRVRTQEEPSPPEWYTASENSGPAEQFCYAFGGPAFECDGLSVSDLEQMFANDCAAGHTTIDSFQPAMIETFRECAATLACDDANDVDDICFPAALRFLRTDALLDEATLEACLGATAACVDHVDSGAMPSLGPVTDCLTSWAACRGQPSDPFWTEDFCLTMLLLTDSARSAAADCTSLACDEVTTCLIPTGAFNY